MNDFLKKNLITILIVLATVILAAVAIFTAIRLYQTRQGTVAPNAPTSNPAAATVEPEPTYCQLQFTVGATASPTASPTATPTATPTASPTASPTPSPSPSPTPVPQCGTSCSTNADCPSSMVCYVGVCRNPSCTTSTSCVCATASPTATPIVTTPPLAVGSPVATPTLPVSGTTTPTILAIVGGVILLLASLAFAL